MKAILASIILVLGGLAFAAPASSAGQEKSDVCHVADDQQVLLITVADPAIDSHIAHGDSQPGDAIPPSEEFPNGAVFGADCTPVPNPAPATYEELCYTIPGATGYIEEVTYNEVIGVTLPLTAGLCVFGEPLTDLAQIQEVYLYAKPYCEAVVGVVLVAGTRSQTSCVFETDGGGVIQYPL